MAWADYSLRLFFLKGGIVIATTRLMPLHVGKKRTVSTAISDIIDYVKNDAKTDQGRLITSYECDSRMADAEFYFAKQQYIRTTGRIRGKDDVIAYHLRQSFAPGEITPEEANRLGYELAKRFTKGKHAFIVCTHNDRHHLHNHIIINSVTLDCDRKFRNFWGSSQAIRRLNDTICLENGYSIVADPQDSSARSERYPGEKKMSNRDQLRLAIDRALEQKPADFNALLKLLRDAGYEIKQGKNPSFKLTGQKRAARLDTLGDGYAKDDLIAVIAGTRKHVPRKVPVRADEPKKLGLVIDIQRKLQEGKGAGYKQWASVYNLKQLAQSVNYIQDRGLTDYDELAKRTEEASARYHDLGSQIKEIEKRMEETAAMRRHIINYVKTKDVYTAYRKAGYSKKFYAAHESDILIHKAAKQAFDELKIEKLPTVKMLQERYAALEAERKTAYSSYRQAREDMRNLLTAKANVDRLLSYDARKTEKEKEQERR
jgi:hypothetical protein